MADPILQHSKEMYVLYGCSYCHGLYLESRGEATDLMHSRLVGRDENAQSDRSASARRHSANREAVADAAVFRFERSADFADLRPWIHYARQQGRYKELTEAKDSEFGKRRGRESVFRTELQFLPLDAGRFEAGGRRVAGPHPAAQIPGRRGSHGRLTGCETLKRLPPSSGISRCWKTTRLTMWRTWSRI